MICRAISVVLGFQLAALGGGAVVLAASGAQADSYAEAGDRYFDKEDPSVAKLDTLYSNHSCNVREGAVYVFSDRRADLEVNCTRVDYNIYRINFFRNAPILDKSTEGYDRKTLVSLNRAEDNHFNGELSTRFLLKKLIDIQEYDREARKPIKTRAVYDELLQVNEIHAAGSQTEECVVTPQQEAEIDIECKAKYRNYNNNGGVGAGDGLRLSSLYWSADYGAFLPAAFVTDQPIDLRVGKGPWRSQTLSAALTAEQKAKAQSLFAAGFDLYKGGDFVGAQTLINKGLETDPANYLAWFTLGEINRAAWKTKGDQAAAKTGYFDYLRVIDLAPADSTQALLAANYLKEGGMN